jgi:hypothetical protein
LLVLALAGLTAAPEQPSLDAAAKAAADLPRLHSLLVSHRGTLVLELVVATTSSTAVGEERRVHRRTIFGLVEQVLAALTR